MKRSPWPPPPRGRAGAGTASASAATRAVDTIIVCPGTYIEQVTVPAEKDRLTLISRERRQAVIKAPPAATPTDNTAQPDLVRVEGAENVSFASFTITGPQPDVGF
jgi:pectin methylesterase-like acyl-CoA thioesterase